MCGEGCGGRSGEQPLDLNEFHHRSIRKQKSKEQEQP